MPIAQMGSSVALYHVSILESLSEYMHIEILILIFKAQNLLYVEVMINLTLLFKLSVSALIFLLTSALAFLSISALVF